MGLAEYCWNSTVWNLEFDETVPLCFHAYTGQLRLGINLLSQTISMSVPMYSRYWNNLVEFKSCWITNSSRCFQPYSANLSPLRVSGRFVGLCPMRTSTYYFILLFISLLYSFILYSFIIYTYSFIVYRYIVIYYMVSYSFII